MTLPGFTAEAAAAPAASAYAAVHGVGLGSAVIAAAFGFRLPVFRCCRRAPLLGNRFVCAQQHYLPGGSCTCIATLSGPLITCRNPELSQF